MPTMKPTTMPIIIREKVDQLKTTAKPERKAPSMSNIDVDLLGPSACATLDFRAQAFIVGAVT
jgi:hypothetical protein